MSAFTSKEQVAILPSTRISFAEHYTADRAARPTLFARIAAFFQRQATLRELGELTDRELADIGLQRSDLRQVFQPAFAAARSR